MATEIEKTVFEIVAKVAKRDLTELTSETKIAEDLGFEINEPD